MIATTRGLAKADALRANGAEHVVIDTGQIAEEVARRWPGGVDALLELIGPVTLLDSLRAVRPGGIVCHTGLLGNEWIMERFEPLEDIPSAVKLTTYHSGTTSAERSTAPLQEIVNGIAAGRYRANVARRRHAQLSAPVDARNARPASPWAASGRPAAGPWRPPALRAGGR